MVIVDPGARRIFLICTSYLELLLKIRGKSGFVPCYIDEQFRPREQSRFNEEIAEPAVSAHFLVELYKAIGDEHDLRAVRKATDYIQKSIVAENTWFDCETFRSCSPEACDFYDTITGQLPQNNMGAIQAAKALLWSYEATGERHYLDWGLYVLEYLSLTRQVWSHPRLSPNLIGGSTTQTSDAEWSDVRQPH